MQHDDERSDGRTSGIDEELSALLDGELDTDSATALRAQIAADPELAERFARFGEIDDQLRRIAAAPPDAARLARLRGDLQARLDARAPGAGLQRRAGKRPQRRSRIRVLIPYAAAVAAGIGLYFLLAGRPGPEPREGDAPGAAPRIADIATLSVEHSVEQSVEQAAEKSVEPSAIPEPLPDAGIPAPGDDASEETLLASLSDEELAVALQLDVLRDLDAIENLELLELLAVLDGPEPL